VTPHTSLFISPMQENGKHRTNTYVCCCDRLGPDRVGSGKAGCREGVGGPKKPIEGNG